MKITITTNHPASSYGVPVCLLDGEPVDPASGFRRCCEELGWSRADVASAINKSAKAVDTYRGGLGPVPAEVWLVLRDALSAAASEAEGDAGALADAFAPGKIPVDPPLPKMWDHTPHNERPSWHLVAWGRPYVTSQTNEHWPNGIRYDVRCLDGGAWDRSTALASFGDLETAITCARNLS